MTVFIHIGRGKAGSSTIQKALGASVEALSAAGIVMPAGVNDHVGAGNHAAVADALRWSRDLQALEELKRLITSPGPRHVVVSSEFLFDVDREALRRLWDIVGPDSVILAYLRNYVDWLPSLHAQRVRKGRTRLDLDAFARPRRYLAPVRSALQRWASVFGPEQVRVRHLDALAGGSLIADVGSVLGVGLTAVDDANVSPSWVETDLLRTMYLVEPTPGTLATMRPALRRAMRCLRTVLDGIDIPRRAWLRPEDAEAVEQLYRVDVDWCEQSFGTPPPPRRTVFPERPLSPVLASLPATIKTVIDEQVLRPASRDAYLNAVTARVHEQMWRDPT